MADATRNIASVDATCGPASVLLMPEQTLKSGVTIYQGAAVFRDPADSALLKTAPSGNPMYEPWGVAMAKVVGDGALRPDVSFGPHVFDNAASTNAIMAAVVVLPCAPATAMTRFPSMWPQRLGATWSSMKSAATPARS